MHLRNSYSRSMSCCLIRHGVPSSGAAVKGGIEPYVLRAGHGKTQSRTGVIDLSKFTAIHAPEEGRGIRVVTVHEGLHHELVGAAGSVEQPLHFRGIAMHRLLAQHVLARLDCSQGPVDVFTVRHRDVHRL